MMAIQAQRWLRRGLWTATLVLLMTLAPSLAWADQKITDNLNATTNPPAELFAIHCVGCHPDGGNIIRRSKNLRPKALSRYGYTDTDSISQIITNGRGVMSAYKDRLTSAEIFALASYVLEQADNGWQ